MSVKTFDFTFEDNVVVEKNNIIENKSSNFDFDPKITQEHSFLVKFHAINMYYSNNNRNMEKLLNDLDITTRGSNMYCPFHNDEITGKPSAKYHPESDMVYCFSESKVYTAYHALKILYGFDMNKIFKEAWLKLSDIDKEEILRKYGDEENIDKREFINPIWKELTPVLSQFMFGNVEFKKHKIALYKIMMMIADSKIPKKNIDSSNDIMLP